APVCPQCHTALTLGADSNSSAGSCSSCGTAFLIEPPPPEVRAAKWASQLGKYELLEVVGQGSFGVVYRARDPELDRVVALKTHRLGGLAPAHEVDRFLREARSAAQVHHPNVVAVHDAGQLDGLCYLVSEYVQGTTLTSLLARGRLPFRQTAE